MSKHKLRWDKATDEEKARALKALGIEWPYQFNEESMLPPRGLHLYEECTQGLGCVCGLEDKHEPR